MRTAVRKRTAVSLYVALVCFAAAAASVAAGVHDPAPFTLNIVAFMILATLTDLREVKLPFVGDVTLSFVPVLAASSSSACGRPWPSPPCSGLASAWATHDATEDRLQHRQLRPLHLSRRGRLPGPGAGGRALHDEGRADVRRDRSSTSSRTPSCWRAWSRSPRRTGALKVWRQNYQWALARLPRGHHVRPAARGALHACSASPGMLLAIPPLYLIYYSYDIYVKRARER